ncbi:MAG: hypothetical protein GYA60_03375 [Candidatus Methanofastidiosa archaeon]|nr:hypothetical protein [Candidatus Methanofastidiosa archaeon]
MKNPLFSIWMNVCCVPGDNVRLVNSFPSFIIVAPPATAKFSMSTFG